MAGKPLVEVARQVLPEVSARYPDYHADILFALKRIATLDDPSTHTRRRTTLEIVSALADKIVARGDNS
jgi:hypothetical protein